MTRRKFRAGDVVIVSPENERRVLVCDETIAGNVCPVPWDSTFVHSSRCKLVIEASEAARLAWLKLASETHGKEFETISALAALQLERDVERLMGRS